MSNNSKNKNHLFGKQEEKLEPKKHLMFFQSSRKVYVTLDRNGVLE